MFARLGLPTRPSSLHISRAMSRREMSTSPAPGGERALKRQKLGHLTPESFKNGVFLAPMVRSGARASTQLAQAHRLSHFHSTNPFDCS